MVLIFDSAQTLLSEKKPYQSLRYRNHNQNYAQINDSKDLAATSEEPTSWSEDEKRIQSEIVKNFRVGNYQKALALLDLHNDELGHSPAFYRWIHAQYPTVLTSLGWLKLNLGDCHLALSFFERAIKFKELKEAKEGLGYCYHHNGDLIAAQNIFIQLLDEDQANEQYLKYLLDIFESLGELDQLQVFIEKAMSVAVEEQKEKLNGIVKLAKLKGVRSSEQNMFEGNNFRVFTPQYLDTDFPILLLNYLDGVYSEFIQLFNCSPLLQKIDVFLYEAEHFREVSGVTAHWVGGVFDGKIRVPLWVKEGAGREVVLEEKLKNTLKHEFVHAYLAQRVGKRSLPTWFDEGVAQFFTCYSTECRVFNGNPDSADFLSSEDFSKSFLGFSALKASLAYKQSLYKVLIMQKIDSESLSATLDGLSPQVEFKNGSFLRSSIDYPRLFEVAKESWLNKTLPF